MTESLPDTWEWQVTWIQKKKNPNYHPRPLSHESLLLEEITVNGLQQAQLVYDWAGIQEVTLEHQKSSLGSREPSESSGS